MTKPTDVTDLEVAPGFMDPGVVFDKDLEEGMKEIADLEKVALTTGELDGYFAHAKSLIKNARLSGIKLARQIAFAYNNWDILGWEEDGVSTITILAREFGLQEQTISKYTKVWTYVFDQNDALSDEEKRVVQGLPMTALMRLSSAAKEQVLDEGDWHEVTQATTHADIHDIVKDKPTGKKKTGKVALNIYIDMQGDTPGRITYRRGNRGPLNVLGFVNLEDLDEDGTSVIERIKRKSGIKERF